MSEVKDNTRRVYIQVDSTHEYREFDSKATTLGDLKSEIEAMGISCEGLEFNEASTMAVYTNPDSPLPEEVYSSVLGSKTRDLAFVLVKKNKNLNSGRSTSSVSLDRKQAYELIKENNLVEAFVDEYKRKPNSAKTDDIYNFLVKHGLDDQIEIIMLDKFGNKPKDTKPVLSPKQKDNSEKLKECIKTGKERKVETTEEVRSEVVVVEIEAIDPSCIPSGSVEAEANTFKKVAKPKTIEEECIEKCDTLIEKIGKVMYTIVKNEATKEDLITWIECRDKEFQMDIMNHLQNKLVEKKPFNAEYLAMQANKIKRGK